MEEEKVPSAAGSNNSDEKGSSEAEKPLDLKPVVAVVAEAAETVAAEEAAPVE